MSTRRRYPCRITVNQRVIHEIVIDPHYEVKHSHSMNDDLILLLVHELKNQHHEPVQRRSGFSYFVKELELNACLYRLVWVLEDKEEYLGVINAFRRL